MCPGIRSPDSVKRARMTAITAHRVVVRETTEHELEDLAHDPWELHNPFDTSEQSP